MIISIQVEKIRGAYKFNDNLLINKETKEVASGFLNLGIRM
jgi:hypothetical protein